MWVRKQSWYGKEMIPKKTKKKKNLLDEIEKIKQSTFHNRQNNPEVFHKVDKGEKVLNYWNSG